MIVEPPDLELVNHAEPPSRAGRLLHLAGRTKSKETCVPVVPPGFCRKEERPCEASGNPQVLEAGGQRMVLSVREIAADARARPLTRKGSERLALSARHSWKVVTQPLSKVWGEAQPGDARCQRVYSRRLRAKLGDASSTPRFIRIEPRVRSRLIAGEAS